MAQSIAIYVITNIVNAKQYVGVTNNLKRRWNEHKTFKRNLYIGRAIKKYGIENFLFTHIVNAFDIECAYSIEQMLIKEKNTRMPNGYNMTDGGEGGNGLIWSEESRDKISKAMIGNKNGLGTKRTEETRKKMREARVGLKYSDEAKVNISKGHIGLKLSEDTKEKLSIASKANWVIRKAQKHDIKEGV